MDLEVQHDERAKKFYVRLGDYEAFLLYARQGDLLDFYHTYVPESHRMQGLAERIVATGFQYALTRSLKVRPSCSYVSEFFVPRHPEFRGLLEQSS